MLLILGKVPPPIGGVSIHVSRLIKLLTDDAQVEFPYHFIKISKTIPIDLIKMLPSAKALHLHSSSPYLRFSVALLCLLFRVKLFITYHGNLGRFNNFKNLFDYLSVWLCHTPIVINDNSLVKAKSWNSKTKLISAFIPPVDLNEDVKLCEKVTSFSKLYETVFCTNAFNLTYDKYGKEIYGITFLLTFFEQNSRVGLVFSDPSGNYTQHFKERGYIFPANVYVISQPHSFVSIIKRSNCMLRTTTTDGDSLSVREALFFKKDVIASDCVSRPVSVMTYKRGDFNSFKNLMLKYLKHPPVFDKEAKIENGYVKLIELYKTIMK